MQFLLWMNFIKSKVEQVYGRGQREDLFEYIVRRNETTKKALVREIKEELEYKGGK